MPSNINSVIKKKKKNIYISDRPTLIYQYVTVNTHIIIINIIIIFCLH